MSDNNNPTEIERAACTMLAADMDKALNPAISEWAKNVVQDGGYTEFPPEGVDPRDRHVFNYREVTDPHERRYHKLMDAALVALGAAIVIYRIDRRPTGDQETYLTGNEEEGGIMITTSLAASVAEYHQAVVNALYTRFETD